MCCKGWDYTLYDMYLLYIYAAFDMYHALISLNFVIEDVSVSCLILDPIQIRVKVRDSGTPVLEDATSVFINVERNLNIPEFSQAQYNLSIPENRPVNTEILDLDAIDNDGVSHRWVKENLGQRASLIM